FVRFPVEIAQPKMNIGFSWRNARCGLKFCDRFRRATHPIKRLADEHVRSSGVRLRLEDAFETIESARISLGPQTTLSQHLLQFRVVPISLCRDLEMVCGFSEVLGAVIAQPQQSSRLLVV